MDKRNKNIRYDWLGKVIHKGVKLDHTNKWYMHTLECILENETYRILLD